MPGWTPDPQAGRISAVNPYRMLKSLLEALQGGGDPNHAAAGFALGAALGLVPKDTLFTALFLLSFFVVRADKGLAFLSAALFTPLAYAFDGPAHALGSALLSSAALAPLWTALYDMPVVPWTRFNNTVVLGNLALGLALLAPLFLASRRAIVVYRERWKPVVDSWPWVKALKALNVLSRLKDWAGIG